MSIKTTKHQIPWTWYAHHLNWQKINKNKNTTIAYLSETFSVQPFGWMMLMLTSC